MFGLEKATKKGPKEADKDLYDLEIRIRDNPREVKEHVKTQVRTLKEALRKGGQEEYDQLGLLLTAYTSLDKLAEKVERSFKRTSK